MSTGRESVCCCEMKQVVDKKSEHESHIQCIVDHEDFSAICLNFGCYKQPTINTGSNMVNLKTKKSISKTELFLTQTYQSVIKRFLTIVWVCVTHRSNGWSI